MEISLFAGLVKGRSEFRVAVVQQVFRPQSCVLAVLLECLDLFASPGFGGLIGRVRDEQPRTRAGDKETVPPENQVKLSDRED